MLVTVLSINKKLYQGEAESVTLPSQDGEIQVLPGHAFFCGLLGMGAIKVDNRVIPVSSGIAEVKDNQIVVLVEQL